MGFLCSKSCFSTSFRPCPQLAIGNLVTIVSIPCWDLICRTVFYLLLKLLIAVFLLQFMRNVSWRHKVLYTLYFPSWMPPWMESKTMNTCAVYVWVGVKNREEEDRLDLLGGLELEENNDEYMKGRNSLVPNQWFQYHWQTDSILC